MCRNTVKAIVATTAVLLLLTRPGPALSQNRAAILAIGSGGFGEFSSVGKRSDLSDRAFRGLAPGAEFIIKPQSRLSIGISFTRLAFRDTQYHNGASGNFAYQNPDGSYVIVEVPEGVEYAAYDLTQEAKLNGVIGSLYLNVLKTGVVRPFIGGGAGAGFGEITNTYVETYHPLFRQYYPDFQLEKGDPTSRQTTLLVKGVGGINIFAGKNFMMRLLGGYLNGGHAEVGFGIVF